MTYLILKVTKNIHKKKTGRAIASGDISLKGAIYVLLILLFVGLYLGLLLSTKFFFLQLIFIGMNWLYSAWLKHIPYIDVFANASTQALRTATGILLAGATIFAFKDMIITHLLCAATLGCFRRHKEYKTGILSIRPVLTRYSAIQLRIMQIAAYTIAIVHFLFTINASGMMFRIFIIITTCVVLYIHRDKKSMIKTALDEVYFGKTTETI